MYTQQLEYEKVLVAGNNSDMDKGKLSDEFKKIQRSLSYAGFKTEFCKPEGLKDAIKDSYDIREVSGVILRGDNSEDLKRDIATLREAVWYDVPIVAFGASKEDEVRYASERDIAICEDISIINPAILVVELGKMLSGDLHIVSYDRRSDSYQRAALISMEEVIIKAGGIPVRMYQGEVGEMVRYGLSGVEGFLLKKGGGSGIFSDSAQDIAKVVTDTFENQVDRDRCLGAEEEHVPREKVLGSVSGDPIPRGNHDEDIRMVSYRFERKEGGWGIKFEQIKVPGLDKKRGLKDDPDTPAERKDLTRMLSGSIQSGLFWLERSTFLESA